jgi:hypothetical protein
LLSKALCKKHFDSLSSNNAPQGAFVFDYCDVTWPGEIGGSKSG